MGKDKVKHIENGFTHHSSPITHHQNDGFTHHPSPNYGRLYWHSRRGMLELDLLLERFWENFGDGLSADDARALEILLGYEDNDLLELILGGESATIAGRVLQMLRADR